MDTSQHLLLREGEPVTLTPKQFATLEFLVQNPGRLITKEEILSAVWPDSFVEESNLTQNIYWLRKILGQTHTDRYIVTLKGSGYRFVAPVQTVEPETSADIPSPQPLDTRVTTPARSRRHWIFVATPAALTLGALVLIATKPWHHSTPVARHAVLLAQTDNRTGIASAAGGIDSLLRQAAQDSPNFAPLSDATIADQLAFMERPTGTALLGETALELCERENLPVTVEPTLVLDGGHKLLLLAARNCQDKSTLVQTTADVSQLGEEKAIHQSVQELGQKMQTLWSTLPPPPLYIMDGTTSSMEALRAYSRAEQLRVQGESMQAIPAFKRALQLDPHLATACSRLGAVYMSLHETAEGMRLISLAYQWHNRATDLERMRIDASYDNYVTHDEAQRDATLKLWQKLAPGTPVVYVLQAIGQRDDGHYEEALQLAQQGLSAMPSNGAAYSVLIETQLALGHISDAESTLAIASQHGLHLDNAGDVRTRIALLRNDPNVVDTSLQSWHATDMQFFADATQTRILMLRGRPQAAAQKATQAAIDERSQDMPENAQLTLLDQQTAAALYSEVAGEKSTPSRPVPAQIESERTILDLALLGRDPEAKAMIAHMEAAAPLYSRLRDTTGSVVDAAALLRAHQPRLALQRLEACRPYERAGLECAWLRARAQLALGDTDAALQSFTEVVQLRGVNAYSVLPILAQVEGGRLLVLAGHTHEAKDQYDAVLTQWKSAEEDAAIVTAVRNERTALAAKE